MENKLTSDILSELDMHICELDDFHVVLDTFVGEYGQIRTSCECGKHNRKLHNMIGGLHFINRYVRCTVNNLRNFSEESYDLYFKTKECARKQDKK